VVLREDEDHAPVLLLLLRPQLGQLSPNLAEFLRHLLQRLPLVVHESLPELRNDHLLRQVPSGLEVREAGHLPAELP